MKKSIIWSKDASDDLIEIITFISDRSGKDIAISIYNKIRGKVQKIIENPKCGRRVPELIAIGISDILELIESPWRIFYRIKNNQIHILTVIDARRNVEELLYKKVIDGKIE